MFSFQKRVHGCRNVGIFAENGVDGLRSAALVVLSQQRLAVERPAEFFPLGRVERTDGGDDGLNGSHG